MQNFRHIKAFGQHFLKSEETALRIVNSLQPADAVEYILEIGPGLGVLTKHLLQIKNKTLFVSEIDTRMTDYLKNDLHIAPDKIIEGDFLKTDITKLIPGRFAVIGNFPYNISSQILFRIADHKNDIPVVVGMFQKEMAQRVAASHGNKNYGVITVLLQAYYSVEYLFELSPGEFDPPPKVHSAVLRLTRKNTNPDCDEKLLRQVVKTAFNQRRKKLSNALSSIEGVKELLIRNNFADKRAEQLSVEDFIFLTKQIQNNA